MAQPPVPRTIDVVITNHDYGRFLREAVDSVLGQAGPPATVIIVDDGSTDDSRGVIESYGGAVTALFQRQGGQASAFNAGFVAGVGEIVVFLDADDALLPGALERIRAAFAGGGVAKTHYRLAVIGPDGRRTGEVKPMRHVTLPQGDLRAHVLAFPLDVVWMATSGNAFSRTALERLFPLPTRLGSAGADGTWSTASHCSARLPRSTSRSLSTACMARTRTPSPRGQRNSTI